MVGGNPALTYGTTINDSELVRATLAPILLKCVLSCRGIIGLLFEALALINSMRTIKKPRIGKNCIIRCLYL